MKGFILEKLQKKDIPEAANFERRLICSLSLYKPKARTDWSRELTPRGLQKQLNRGAVVFVIKNEGGKIMGFISYYPYPKNGVGWIDWVLVDPNFRRKGLGKLLIKQVMNFAKKHGEHVVWNDTLKINYKSIGLFKKLGFAKLGLFKNAWYHQDYYLWYRST